MTQMHTATDVMLTSSRGEKCHGQASFGKIDDLCTTEFEGSGFDSELQELVRYQGEFSTKNDLPVIPGEIVTLDFFFSAATSVQLEAVVTKIITRPDAGIHSIEWWTQARDTREPIRQMIDELTLDVVPGTIS